MSGLPVDSIIPEIIAALDNHTGVVLQAPPGSGKTSRVPVALLESPSIINGSIIMLEPRRLAAVNAASWIARNLGEPVGKSVGYAIRFNRKVSRETRLEIITEGLLTRRLQSDPELDGVGAVIFDEFHERSIHADTALAFCLDVQRSIRPDLKIIVMSATIDTAAVSRLMGGVPEFGCTGKSHPVELRYLGDPSGDVVPAVCRVVQQALRETVRDILVFLPGAGEIRRCAEQLGRAVGSDILITRLFGDLPFEEQERAIVPAETRKVVLATNIAETSLTIEGVGAVVDSGLMRRIQYDPSTGMDRLVTVRVSDASATQRAGRAGRLGPGVCYRLWSEGSQAALLPFNPPEIRIADLTPLALELAAWGSSGPGSLSWLDLPSQGAFSEAQELLRSLGALDRQDRITQLGREMAEIPLHPRLARLVLAGKERCILSLACDLAPLLEERDIFRRDVESDRPATDCDYSDRLEALRDWRQSGRVNSHGLDSSACRQVDRAAERLRRQLGAGRAESAVDHADVARLLATAYPDRIARKRASGGNRYLLANGFGAAIGRRSAVQNREFVVAVEIAGNAAADGTIHGCCSLGIDLIRDIFSGVIARRRSVVWNESEGRVMAAEDEMLGSLVLSSRPVLPSDEDTVPALFAVVAADPDLAALPWTDEARQFQARLILLGRACPERGFPDIGDQALRGSLGDWLAPSMSGIRSMAALRKIDLLSLLKGICSWDQLRLIDEGVPTHLTVPSGSRIRIDYSSGEPTLGVKLQEMFGCADTPTVAWGRVPLLIHLLSPARRPIQITRDLRSFWNSTYPEVKRELKGRYPRHPWPDDPWNAVPTGKTKKSMVF